MTVESEGNPRYNKGNKTDRSDRKGSVMPTVPTRRILPLFPALALPAVLSLFGWAASYFYNLFNSDVTMPDWSVEATLLAAEILPALRTAALLAFVACFAYAGESIGRIVAVAGCGIGTNLLFGLASTWFSEGFGLFNPVTLVTDLILCAAAFFIALSVKRKADRAKSSHSRRSWSPGRAAVLASLPAAIPPVLYAALDLADHIKSRGSYADDVFAGGVAFFTGTLVRRILIYAVLGAVAAWIVSGIAMGRKKRGEVMRGVSSGGRPSGA